MTIEWLRNIFPGGANIESLTTTVMAQLILDFTSWPFGGRRRFSPEDIPFTAQDILTRLSPSPTIKPARLPGNTDPFSVLDRKLASLAREGVLERLPVDDPTGDGQSRLVTYVVRDVGELRRLSALSKESK
jgi:hypothetical protein